MPWQRQVADVGGELLDNGLPAYREVTIGVPRQEGKTTLLLAWKIQRALGWAKILGRPQAIRYSAQTALDAREKLIDDLVPILEQHRRTLGIARIRRANGSEAVIWKNGSNIKLLSSSEDSGHGRTVDLGVEDELFADHDFRRDQALFPAMATRAHGQILNASTAGTAESIAWNTKVARGRAAVEAGETTGLAYFEWSADPDEDDPADPATWWSCMPALGRTITLEVVEHAYQNMKLEEFKRAWLNIPTSAAERVIPESVWDLVCSPDVEATGEVFGLDVNPERSAAGIVAAGAGPVVEVVDYRAGTGWLVARAVELHQTYGAPFALDPKGPAGSFASKLEAKGVPVILCGGEEMPTACADFYDRVVEEQLEIRRHEGLDAAVAGAAKRTVGDRWVWGRKSSRFDISLLVAATVAVWALERAAGAEDSDVADNVW